MRLLPSSRFGSSRDTIAERYSPAWVRPIVDGITAPTFDRTAGSGGGGTCAQRTPKRADSRGNRAYRLDPLQPLHGARALRAESRLLRRRQTEILARRGFRHRS